MKYSTPDHDSKHRFLIVFSFILLFFLFLIIVLTLFFPIKITDQTNNTDKKWYSKFVVTWPEFLVKQEIRERKKLKRYQKSEIQRRFTKQINAMQTLNVPLYNLWFDNNFESFTYNSNSSPNSGSFFWPTLPAKNIFTKKNRNVEYVIFPELENIKLEKGFYLGSGEFIKSNIPISNVKKVFTLEILPLSTGRIKVTLGQYVWTKTLFENDLHKIKKYNIPINDPFAQTYKISNVSSSFYVLNANVIANTSNAREIIYVANQSKIWSPNPANIPEGNLDPLLEISNQSQLSDRDSTLAKGYNILVLSVDSTLSENVLQNKKKFSKLMPIMYEHTKQAARIQTTFDDTKTDYQKEIPSIYKKYGYKTAIFSTAETFKFNSNIASFKNYDSISKSWLTKSDSLLRQAINSKNDIKTDEGLSAVFKQPVELQKSGLQANSFAAMSAYFENLSELLNSEYNLKFDDTIIISEKNYLQNLIRMFQKWSLDQKQSRFYGDLSLSVKNLSHFSSFQDFIAVLIKSPTFNLKKFNAYLQMRVLDREFNYLLDTLQAQHIINRTIVMILFKNQTFPEQSEALLFIPGLKPKNNFIKLKASIKDLMLYQMALVGIPVETGVRFEKNFKNIESNQDVALNFNESETEPASNTFTVVIRSNKKNCTPLTWKSNSGLIFDIKSNLPFYEVFNQNTIKFFPCAFGENTLEIQWKQKKLPDSVGTSLAQNLSTKHVYGGFFSSDEGALTADLYYGKSLINRKLLPFNFHHTPQQMETFFVVDQKDIDYTRNFALKSFQSMQYDPKLTENTRIAFFVSHSQ